MLDQVKSPMDQRSTAWDSTSFFIFIYTNDNHTLVLL